jgi:citrate lyase beta subunit
MYDLEDSVPPQHKDRARDLLVQWLQSEAAWDYRGLIAVRINPGSPDVAALNFLAVRCDALVIPKVREWHELTGYPAPVIPVIETPQAVLGLEALIAMPEVKAAIFGIADYAAGIGVSDRVFADRASITAVNRRFAYAKQKLVTCCAAYGKPSLDTCFVVKGPRAEARIRQQWRISRSFGFTGAACIHPLQVAVAKPIFGPSARELSWAEATRTEHLARDEEVGVDADGIVVGMPVARQAEAILSAKGERK